MNAENYFRIHYMKKCFPNEDNEMQKTINESEHSLIGKIAMNDFLLCIYRKFALIYLVKQKGLNQ